MRSYLTQSVIGAVSLALLASTLVLAEANKQGSATVVDVDMSRGVYTVKDYDGKTYELDKTQIVEKDLKTGDTVVYDIVESMPVHVRKKP